MGNKASRGIESFRDGESYHGGVTIKAVLRFSRTQLTRKLDRLPLPLCVIFAAACAERLLPGYIIFSDLTGQGDPDAIKRALARLWEDVGGSPMTEDEVRANISTCMDLIPPDDDVSLGAESDYAENASAAVVYALTCLQKGDSQQAAWSADQAYEALGHFVINRDNVNLNALGALSRIVANPLIQAELARQYRDLDELLGAVDGDVRQTAAKFRQRAQAEAKIFFGAPS